MGSRTAKSEMAGPANPIPFKQILVPTDFSACADQAFAYALHLARRYEAEVHLLHVIGQWEGDAYSPLHYSPEANALRETPDSLIYDLLQAAVKRQHTAGIRIETVQRRGAGVAATILQQARTLAADLIVMGTHGRQGVQRFFMGSVAERTVRYAPCAVLTVREQGEAMVQGEAPAGRSLQRILVPVDFSAVSMPLLRAAHALALVYHAQLDLLHVIEPLPFLGTLTGVITVNDLVPNVRERTKKALQHLWKQVGAHDVLARLHMDEGHAAAHIVDFASRCGADLIMIASQGRSSVARFLIGSVAERVVRTAPCPVLIMKLKPAEAAALHAQSAEAAVPARKGSR